MPLAFFGKSRLRKAIDVQRVTKAIEETERRTSGEVRVCIAPFFWGNVEREADRAFHRLGMDRTEQRNGILFFLVPARRRFVVRGDEGIHAKVGAEFWTAVADAVSERFRRRDFTGGLVLGIETVGQQLQSHFPFDPGTDRDELSNEVAFGD